MSDTWQKVDSDRIYQSDYRGASSTKAKQKNGNRNLSMMLSHSKKESCTVPKVLIRLKRIKKRLEEWQEVKWTGEVRWKCKTKAKC